MTPNTLNASLPSQNDNALKPPHTTKDVLRDALERSVAAKIVSILPPDDEAAERILRHAAALYQGFVSIEACQAARAAEAV